MRGRWVSLLGLVTIAASASPSVCAAAGTVPSSGCAAYVPEAARRSGLSEDVIVRVMLAESAGKTRIVSVKGAIGCMQIMPATWAYLTARYKLGSDPYDAPMNMIGGAMYLAELASRYGWPGALAAYNAGPGRYRRSVQDGVRLPTETIAYAARLSGNADAPRMAPLAARWQDARLFLARPTVERTQNLPSAPPPSPGTGDTRERNSLFPLSGRADSGNAER